MRARIGTYIGKLAGVLRARGGQIAYCCAIALALTGIACAAEAYRGRRDVQEAGPLLPAVELSAPEAGEDEAAICQPAGAQLLRGYSAAPVWSAALGLWESHQATDYRLDGDRVESLYAGEVRAVGRDARGGFVEVTRGDVTLRYCSISPREDLEPGKALEAGEILGTADASMPGEAGLGAHLHLEAELGSARVDFTALARGD